MTWSRRAVADRFREAWDTLRRMPSSRVPGFVSSWPPYVRDLVETTGTRDAVIRLASPSPRAIDRMHEVFGWFVVLEDQAQLTAALWLTAAMGMGPKRAGVILGAHRDTVRQRRDRALDMIAEVLNAREAAAA